MRLEPLFDRMIVLTVWRLRMEPTERIILLGNYDFTICHSKTELMPLPGVYTELWYQGDQFELISIKSTDNLKRDCINLDFPPLCKSTYAIAVHYMPSSNLVMRQEVVRAIVNEYSDDGDFMPGFESVVNPDQVVRLFMVEDQDVLRTAYRLMLERFSDIRIVGEASRCMEAVSKILLKKPTVVLMDISLVDGDGISLTQKIKRVLPDVHVLMNTAYSDQVHVASAMMAGADGYCLKNSPPVQIAQAIRTVAGGKIWLDPRLCTNKSIGNKAS